MSDAVMGRRDPDRKRILASIGVALVVHVVAILLLSIVARLESAREAPPPVTVDLQLESGPVLATAPGPSPSASAAVAAAVPSAAAAAPAGTGGGGSDFVIPSPAGVSPDTAPVPTGPSFQASGGKTGVGQTLPAVSNQLPQPNVAVSPKGRTGAAGGAAASGADLVQRSGQGVAVGGQTKGSSGNLDLSQLDRAIAGGGTGTGAARGTGSAQSGTGTGGGGTGAGAGGGSGSGSGGYSVVWDAQDASKGRQLVSTVRPKLPAWVGQQGLSLSVKVFFTLMADGGVTGVGMEQSSGYADVDSSIVDAIRHWKFTASKGAAPIKGLIPYVVKPQ